MKPYTKRSIERYVSGALLLAAAVVGTPRQADAQLSVQVGLYWEFGDDGWRPYRTTDYYPRTVYRTLPERVIEVWPRYEVVRGGRDVRVPPGHMPPPGFCRLWYPGRPPGHQPPARPCGDLFRWHRQAGAVIIGLPSYDEVHGWNDRGRGRRGKAKGRRGRGRGG